MKYITKLNKLSKLIGKTPLIKIKYLDNGVKKHIFAKLEWFNLSGSIKDRIAYYIIKKAYDKGELKPNQHIVEVTSGNTGISFSAIGGYLGHKITIIMPDFMSDERKKILKIYGADLVLVSRENGGFNKCIEISKSFKTAYLPRQFENKYNIESQEKSLGKEIIEHIKNNNLNVSYFVAGVGTGGTLIGVGKALKKKKIPCKICAIEPANSPTLSTGYKVGCHKIEGISDDFVPEIFKNNKNIVDKIIGVTDDESILMAQMMAKQLGLGVGISSGANILGCILLNRMGTDNSLTVLPDDNKKYLSTTLTEKINNKLSSQIKFISYERIK